MKFPLPLLLALLPLACSAGGHSSPPATSPAIVAPERAAAVVYSGRTFTGTPGHEALEIVGRRGVILQHCTFVGGSTCLRITDCTGVVVENCTFGGATGPADPDGQCLQLLRSTGTVRGCRFMASPASEDLLNVYADRATPGAVTVIGCAFYGRGRSDSGTSLCIDGKFPPATSISGCTFADARCAVTIAGGKGHALAGCRFAGCGVGVYAASLYGGEFGPVAISGVPAALMVIGQSARASVAVRP